MIGRPDVSSRRRGCVQRQAALVLLLSSAFAITPSAAGIVAPRCPGDRRSSVSHVHLWVGLIGLCHCLADDAGADLLDTAAYAAQCAPPHSAPLRAR